MTLAEYTSYSGRNFSNANPDFKDEFNLDLQELNLLLFSNEKTLSQFTAKVILNVPTDHPFIDIGTNFYHPPYSTDCYLFDYNGVACCYVYNNIDLFTSFKNKLEVFQSFNLQNLQNTEINNKENIFILFVLGKKGAIYFCVLDGK
jgi:hypothetical protein